MSSKDIFCETQTRVGLITRGGDKIIVITLMCNVDGDNKKLDILLFKYSQVFKM